MDNRTNRQTSLLSSLRRRRRRLETPRTRWFLLEYGIFRNSKDVASIPWRGYLFIHQFIFFISLSLSLIPKYWFHTEFHRKTLVFKNLKIYLSYSLITDLSLVKWSKISNFETLASVFLGTWCLVQSWRHVQPLSLASTSSRLSHSFTTTTPAATTQPLKVQGAPTAPLAGLNNYNLIYNCFEVLINRLYN